MPRLSAGVSKIPEQAVLLTARQSREMLEKFGVYSSEACHKCGQVLGPVRYTRKGETGVWCSQQCRGDAEKTKMLKPGRPRKYRNEKERRRAKSQQQRIYRSRPRVEKTVCMATETKDLHDQKSPLSHYPLSEGNGGPKEGMGRA
jgi:hypothetical protein